MSLEGLWTVLTDMGENLRLQTEILQGIERLTHRPDPAGLVTVREAAKQLSLSERTIRNRIARGDYPSFGTGRELRVDAGELREIMARKVRV